MATLDDIFAAMPDAPTAGTHELLIIDPDTRQIDVPEVEAILGVENDNQAERKYFKCPRYVGDSLDLAACSLRVTFTNANGETDAYIVEDLTVSGAVVLFSWELSRKATKYKGDVYFLVYAGAEDGTDWHTTLASGTVLEGKEVDASQVEEKTSDVITQLLLMVARQTAAVEAEGAAQIAAVQEAATAATAEAKAAVEAKGAATLATIPEDYITLDNRVDALVRSTAGAIVCAAEGETIQVHDASDHHLHGLRIFGRSTQDGTPTPDTPVEIVSAPAPVVTVCGKNLLEITATSRDVNGGTLTVNADKTITLNGTVSQNTAVAAGSTRCSGECIFSVGVDAAAINGSYHYIATPNKNVMLYSGKMFTHDGTDRSVYFVVMAGTYNNVTIKPVIRSVSSADDTYEPYKGRAMTITTPSSLLGIPVTTGGNYIDANGQQWICDEVDLGRGVYVRRVLEVTYDGAGETWYKSKDDNENYLYHISIKQDKSVAAGDCFCNRLQRKNTAEIQIPGKTLDVVGISPSPKYNVIYLNVGYYLSENTIESLTSYLAANPVTVQYALATPIETALSDAEILAFKALRSNKPTTTIMNDAGAHMVAEYVADTKLYIDGKLAEILAANHT